MFNLANIKKPYIVCRILHIKKHEKHPILNAIYYIPTQKEHIMKKIIITIFALLLVFGQTTWAELEKRPKNGEGRGHGKNEFKKEIMAFHKEQKQDRKEFAKTLEGKNIEKRYTAKTEFSQQQYKERITFHDNLHEQRLAKLEDRLRNNEKLSDEEKQQIISQTEA